MEYPRFSHQTRQALVKQLASARGAGEAVPTFDAVVVGGGIVGAGLARELSIRGIKVLLVDKGDFASGTSSKSSKLIHGGLRYLEMLDFHLVFEALAERHWLLKTHPHLVQALEFNLPIYTKRSRPAGGRGAFKLGLGLWFYDALSFFRTPFFHGRHSAAELEGLFPRLREEGLKGSYYYADAMMLDDEIVLETLLDSHRRGARALNYVKATAVGARGSDGCYDVRLEDQLAAREVGAGVMGATASGSAAFSVKAREVIICAGPWASSLEGSVVGGVGRKLKPSKGVHLIVPWKRFPIESCLVMYAADGRIVFAIPRKDLGDGAEHVIIGTTDSPEHGNLDTVHATSGDVAYLLSVLQEYFPKASLRASDIVMTYAGVRPLLDDGAESEAKTSREHEIWRNASGVVFTAGGKYTTFRKISQEIADFAFPRSSSGISAHEASKESRAQLSTPADYEARQAGALVWGRFSEGWVRWKIDHHCPCTLQDIVLRRMPLWMAGSALPAQALDRIADIAQNHFGWDDQRLKQERAELAAQLALGQQWRSK